MKIPQCCKGWFDATDLTKDVKLLAFAAVVVFSIYKLYRSPIDPNWVNAFYGLCALVGLGGTAWSFVEKKFHAQGGANNELEPPKPE